MKLLKKHIAFTFIFTLLLPIAIQTAHAFENHKHATVCKSVKEKHVHKKDFECNDLHFSFKTFALNLTSYHKVTPKQFYKSNFNTQSQIFKTVYTFQKSSRGPPQLA